MNIQNDLPKNFQLRDLFNIPNMLTILRIVLLPFIAWTYLHDKMMIAIFLLLISGISDILDGFIARKFNMTTAIGKVLDPISDKLTQWIILACLAIRFRYLLALFFLLFIKEMIMGLTGFYVVKKTGMVYSSRWHGKATTVLIYTTIMVHFLFPNIPTVFAEALMVASICMMFISMRFYIKDNIKRLNGCKKCSENTCKL
ncbi:MAG: CDP-alcohol phosphatidyltransferase family protein [Schaedlerella sp.]|nr:CDP-alcohol phosphatidyltransferase family protein [Schaedlerella sp.]